MPVVSGVRNLNLKGRFFSEAEGLEGCSSWSIATALPLIRRFAPPSPRSREKENHIFPAGGEKECFVRSAVAEVADRTTIVPAQPASASATTVRRALRSARQDRRHYRHRTDGAGSPLRHRRAHRETARRYRPATRAYPTMPHPARRCGSRTARSRRLRWPDRMRVRVQRGAGVEQILRAQLRRIGADQHCAAVSLPQDLAHMPHARAQIAVALRDARQITPDGRIQRFGFRHRPVHDQPGHHHLRLHDDLGHRSGGMTVEHLCRVLPNGLRKPGFQRRMARRLHEDRKASRGCACSGCACGRCTRHRRASRHAWSAVSRR